MALITCPECKKKISEDAESCPKCGRKLDEKEKSAIKEKEEKFKTGCGIGCLAIVLIFSIIVYIGSSLDSDKNTGAASSPKSCYLLGWKYGRCATQSMRGIPCDPEDDVVIPERCRGLESTREGIKDGRRSVK
jgi:hypothetical protein